MIHETIKLPVHYQGKLFNNNQKPTLTTYLLDNYESLDPTRIRPLIVICPGGGYEHLSVREGEAVAIKMNSLGYHAAILTYSLAPMDFPAALCDAAEAINYSRMHSREWNVNPNKIILGGFSAGGHLAASLGCYWKELSAGNEKSLLGKYLPYTSEDIRPNALLLCYPVITAEQYCHNKSILNVLGENNIEKRSLVSLENKVTKDMPPVFMWHTDADETVPAENSLLFAAALRREHISFEYHLFARGVHGLGLATAETSIPSGYTIEKECAIWPELFAAWFNGL